jgi:hypothetical protein
MCEWLTPEGAIAASIADLDLIASAHPYEEDPLLTFPLCFSAAMTSDHNLTPGSTVVKPFLIINPKRETTALTPQNRCIP